MSRSYSEDLRVRVIAAVRGGLSTRQTAARFGIGVSTVGTWYRRYRATGEAAARTIDELWQIIAEIIDDFTPTQCQNFFTAAGYEPD